MSSQERGVQDTLIQSVILQDTLPAVVLKDTVPVVVRKVVIVKPPVNDTVRLPDSIFRFTTNIIAGREDVAVLPPGVGELKGESFTAVTTDKTLKEGLPVPESPYRNDWTIILLFSTIIMLLFVRLFGRGQIGSVFTDLIPGSKSSSDKSDKQHLFHWSETVFNLLAFINISLFIYFSAVAYGFSPPGNSPVTGWLIIILIVVASITVRHIITFITGAATDTSELFAEYQWRIYQGYRLAGILLFFLVTALCYTDLNPSLWITAGIATLSLIYLLRVLSLFVIFSRKHISLSYLILYLCALEILPVAVIIRLFI